MLDSLVRVSRRGNENHFVKITSTYVTHLNLIQDRWTYKMHVHCYPKQNPSWPASCHSVPAASNRKNMTKLCTGFHRLPFSNFRYFLTLFSKFFASFPHGTCALSVSHQYLALYGIYHTIWAAIPSNSTHWRNILWQQHPGKNGSITLSAALFQGTWPGATVDVSSTDHNSARQLALVTQIHMVSYSCFSRPY